MLEKLIFRNQIKEILLDFILEGNIKPGERISLPTIATKLTVSVTPIREALTQLCETGIVTYIANRGFFVTNLTKKEAIEIYDLMALLESDAVKKSSYNSDQIKELKNINLAFVEAKETKEKLNLDRKFHQKLIENFENESAHKIIEYLRTRISLYEYAFWNANPEVESISMHGKIIEHLASGNKELAVEEVIKNWLIGIQDVIKHFSKKEKTN